MSAGSASVQQYYAAWKYLHWSRDFFCADGGRFAQLVLILFDMANLPIY